MMLLTAALTLMPIPLQPEPQTRPGAPLASSTQPAPATGFLFKVLRRQDADFRYCVFVPPGYTPDKHWPLILFLHGAGERGQDGFLQTEVGLGRAIRCYSDWCRAIVVFPQCRPEQSWTGDMARLALECVEQTAREYPIDAGRLYLTGISLGGAGVWTLAAAAPDRWAAIAPVCGFGEAALAQKLASIPTWVFHGDKDDRVPPARSREMVQAIRQAGGNPRYTEFPGVGHNCWDAAYRDAEFWRWLLQQRLPPKR